MICLYYGWYVGIPMTTLTYRGCRYIKEVESENFRKWWNLAHRATLWLSYRGLAYRPIQIGGLVDR